MDKPTLNEVLNSLDTATLDSIVDSVLEAMSNKDIREKFVTHDMKLNIVRASNMTIEYPDDDTVTIRYLMFVFTLRLTSQEMSFTIDLSKF